MNRTFDANENDYATMVEYCESEGIKLGAFINKAINEKLKKLGLVK